MKKRKLFLFLPGIAAWTALMSWITFRTWNYLSTHGLGLPVISWLQALGIYLLLSIGFVAVRRRFRRQRDPWFMHNKWKNLSAEEKQNLIRFMETKAGCKNCVSSASKTELPV